MEEGVSQEQKNMNLVLLEGLSDNPRNPDKKDPLEPYLSYQPKPIKVEAPNVLLPEQMIGQPKPQEAKSPVTEAKPIPQEQPLDYKLTSPDNYPKTDFDRPEDRALAEEMSKPSQPQEAKPISAWNRLKNYFKIGKSESKDEDIKVSDKRSDVIDIISSKTQ